ncbi:YIP1 family protein [Ekhidna sp.]|uniref:YIP1 family protein n=1 Tax=Ekhidna sp. TaxID=2608089 RepID=UPI003299BDFC
MVSSRCGPHAKASTRSKIGAYFIADNVYIKDKGFANIALKDEQPLFAWPIVILGLSLSLDMAPDISALIDVGFVWWSLLIALPIGIGAAFLILGLIMPGLVRLFGRMWAGQATMRQMVNVYSISSAPFCITIIYQLFQFFFLEDPSLENVNQGLSYIIWLWGFGLLIIGVSKVQKFSYGMALLNIMLSYLPILVLGLIRN